MERLSRSLSSSLFGACSIYFANYHKFRICNCSVHRNVLYYFSLIIQYTFFFLFFLKENTDELYGGFEEVDESDPFWKSERIGSEESVNDDEDFLVQEYEALLSLEGEDKNADLHEHLEKEDSKENV